MILRETKVELGFNGFNDRNSATRCRVAFYTSQRGASWQPISIEDYIKKGEDSMNHMSQSIIWYWNLYQPLKGYIYIYLYLDIDREQSAGYIFDPSGSLVIHDKA